MMLGVIFRMLELMVLVYKLVGQRPKDQHPSDIIASSATLLAAGITKETARLIAQKYLWAGKVYDEYYKFHR